MITTVGFSLWCAIWWRLRGGAFTALTGINPGTLGMRGIAAVAISLPLLVVSWRYACMIPAFYAAWCLSGWGAFQGMGQETNPPEISNPMAALLKRLGLGKTAIDLFGMAFEGFLCCTIIGLPLWFLGFNVDLFGLAGLSFAPIYFIAQHVRYPNAGRFANAGSEWAEVLVGALVGVAVWLELLA